MKLKNKLILAFVVILVMSSGLICLCVSLFNGWHVKILNQSYNVKTENSNLLSANTIELFDALAEKSNGIIQEEIVKNKEYFRDTKYLEELNQRLEEWSSFLIVRNGDKFIFYGSEENWSPDLLSQLPSHEEDESNNRFTMYTGTETNCLLRQNDFAFADGEEGTAFVVTPVKVFPQIKSMYMEVILSVIIILCSTTMILFLWIYSSVLIPIGKLQKATQAIRDGNLDYELQIKGDDEISKLCMDFEDMRNRLKTTSEEQIRGDEENKILISNISHDLKTPITAIKGYVEGIMDGVASSPDKLDKYIRTIYNKANDMDRLIDELTFYSKINANKIPYNFAPLNVYDYFKDCGEELQLDLGQQDIDMTVMNYCDKNVQIVADAEQLKRVINNIISNSVKYMDKKQGIINMRIKDLGDFIQVEIEDNGKGIAAKDLPYIFDRFYRTDKARNSRKGGSGIGLSIVRKIIEEHGGQIWATSKEGIGTVVHFALRKYQEVRHE